MRIVSCEHATNAVPGEWRATLAGATRELMGSHRAWDPGAGELALILAPGDAGLFGEVSRLIIDLNRSPGNPARWSEYTRDLPDERKASLGESFFLPYLARLREEIERRIIDRGFALHLSIHTFTRVLDRVVREVDIGVLFDPARLPEAAIAEKWIDRLRNAAPGLRIRANEPYCGTDDGLTTLLRQAYPPDRYAGIELEVCQSFFIDQTPWEWPRLTDLIVSTAP